MVQEEVGNRFRKGLGNYGKWFNEIRPGVLARANTQTILETDPSKVPGLFLIGPIYEEKNLDGDDVVYRNPLDWRDQYAHVLETNGIVAMSGLDHKIHDKFPYLGRINSRLLIRCSVAVAIYCQGRCPGWGSQFEVDWARKFGIPNQNIFIIADEEAIKELNGGQNWPTAIPAYIHGEIPPTNLVSDPDELVYRLQGTDFQYPIPYTSDRRFHFELARYMDIMLGKRDMFNRTIQLVERAAGVSI
ncbi:MAG: hypothetical protein GF368_04825 [Candidatus Aenigmarchaeota archaeon]|nr:hypothetical protein [Candidatus Aenigmarchaeota archaeon]